MRTTGTHMSVPQRRLLLQQVRADPDLMQGKFRADFTHKDAETRWRKISDQLNELEGATKHWKQWRKAWADYRNRLKVFRENRDKNNAKNGRNLNDDDIKAETNKTQRIETVHVKKDINEDDIFGEDSDCSNRPPSPPQRLLRSKKSKVAGDETDLAENRMKYLLERELDIRSSYYERKLLLMERQVLALERIAKAADPVIV